MLEKQESKCMARDEAIDMDFEALQVLVVDDDPALLSVTCRMLKALGYQVDTAGDGVQAMECMRRKQYNIVVSDMQMPYLDGFSLACWIKRRAKHVRVVVMTGLPMTEVDVYMKMQVADSWLFKPFTKSELRDLLQKNRPMQVGTK